MERKLDKPKDEKPTAEKKRVSVKDGKALKEIERVLPVLFDLYSPVLAEWAKTTPEQRQGFLEHSPLLAKLLAWAREWEVDGWQR